MLSMKHSNTKTNWRTLAILLVIVVGLGLLYVAAKRSGLLAYIESPEELQAWIRGFGALGGVVFFAVQVLTVIIAPIPSNVTTLAGSLALGFWPGFLISSAAVFTGSVLMFLLARKLGAKFVDRFVEKKASSKYLPLIEKKRDSFLFLSLLLPFFPDDAICILAGLTRIPTLNFVVLVLVARPWGLLFSSLVGSGRLSVPMWGWAIIAVCAGALFLLGLKYGNLIEEKLLKKITREA